MGMSGGDFVLTEPDPSADKAEVQLRDRAVLIVLVSCALLHSAADGGQAQANAVSLKAVLA